MTDTQNQQILEKGYEIESFKITSETINQFEIMENRRQISNSHVSQIHGALLRGNNPIGILIVNKKLNKMRLIDGNHRIEAVRKFYNYIKINPLPEIECILKVYHDLTEDEEREIYALEAKRKNESYEDRLNMYKDVIIFWKLLQDKLNQFPCKVTIYKSSSSIKFRTILDAIYSSKSSSRSKGWYMNRIEKDELVPFAGKLKYDDFINLKDFINFFQSVFGRIESSNIYIQTYFFGAIYDIYMKNLQYKDNKSFEGRFKSIIGRSELLNLVHLKSEEISIKVREVMLSYMNKKVSTNTFI